MDRCPVCGSKLDEDATACSICGTAFEIEEARCPLCNSVVDEGESVCPNCGAELEVGGEGPGEGEGGVHHDEPQLEDSDTSEAMSSTEREAARGIADEVLVDVELEELVKLPGVGPLKAKILYDAGYTDLRKLKQASVVELMNIEGIGRKAAGEIKAALRESDLEEIRHTPITKETVEPEYQCPLCGTIVSAYETSCYECGCIFEPSDLGEEDSDRLALSYYDSKLLRDPENKDLWYARGATLVKMGEHEQALNSFNRALAIDPDFQSAWMSKAEVYNILGDSARAAECYSHIISTAQVPGPGEEETGAETEPPEEWVGGREATPVPGPEPEEDAMVMEEPPAPDIQAAVPDDEQPEPDSPPEVPGDMGVEGEPRDESLPEEQAADELPQEEPEEGPAVLKVTADTAFDEPPPDSAGRDITGDEPGGSEDMSQLGAVSPRKANVMPDLDAMSPAELKKYLAKRASHVKPYLALAKELDVDIAHSKRLIARAVAESKKGELKNAIALMEEGIDFAEEEFHRKISGDIEHLAGIVRDLKASGMDVGAAVEHVIASKDALEQGEILRSVDEMRKGLEAAEAAAGAR